jgi:hypothetical protein
LFSVVLTCNNDPGFNSLALLAASTSSAAAVVAVVVLLLLVTLVINFEPSS